VADAGAFLCNSAWTSYSQLNTWQYDQSTVINDNKMYLFGGTTGNYQFFQQFNFADARVSTFDYDNNTSHFLNSVAFILGDNAYLGIGNWDNLFNYSKSFYKFSFSSLKWTQLKDFPGSLRANSFFFSSGSYGYLGTGIAYNGELNDLWQYDPSNDSWTQKSDFPGGATAGATAVMHNGSAYVIDKNNIWLYDPALDHWIKKANFPGQPRFNGVGIDDANGIYYGLGSEKMDLTWEFPTCYSDFWYYSIESDTWNKLPDFPGNRTSAYGFSYNGKIYVGGGGNSLQTFRDIIEFNPDF
jgi:N-acetylneuraminic acid mutarotase